MTDGQWKSGKGMLEFVLSSPPGLIGIGRRDSGRSQSAGN